MNKQTTPMKKAIRKLFELACTVATAAQIKQVAEEFDVEVWQLEGFYFDAVDASAEE